MSEQDSQSILVNFVTKQEQYAIPGASVAVPGNIDTKGLNEIIYSFLKQGFHRKPTPEFNFIAYGKLIVSELATYLKDVGKSLESCIEIEFFEKQPPPTPKDSLQHDDWVSSVHSCGEWLLTGCYDNTVVLWSAKMIIDEEGRTAHLVTVPAHKAPVKVVSWLSTSELVKTFISGSLDQTALVWSWNCENNSVDCIMDCRGHTQGIECLCVDSNNLRFATGSWDNTLKIWSTVESEVDELSDDEVPLVTKKLKSKAKKAKIKTPLMTLIGHSECISGVAWTDSHSLVTSSWDHNLRLWDADVGGMTSQINSNCALFGLSWSEKLRSVITCSSDRIIRLYDPRSNEGNLVKQKFISHTKWVTSVCWNSSNDQTFVSGGHDNLVKMWDIRSPSSPLYDLSGCAEKVLSVDWSFYGHIACGSADCTAKIFSVS